MRKFLCLIILCVMHAFAELCEPNKCQHEGICVYGICECMGEYSGHRCEIQNSIEDLCEPDPCQHGGMCSLGMCHCPDGFTGDKCEIKPIEDLCDPDDPCQHGGMCVVGVCQCLDDFTGGRCESQLMSTTFGSFPSDSERSSDDLDSVQLAFMIIGPVAFVILIAVLYYFRYRRYCGETPYTTMTA